MFARGLVSIKKRLDRALSCSAFRGRCIQTSPLYIKTLLLLLLSNLATAQKHDAVLDSVMAHAKYYSQKNTDALLFAHLDKTVYLDNDVIWFSAYLLNVKTENVSAHQVLSVALVNNSNQLVAVKGRFLMQMGLSFGCLMIPDTVAPGHYTFVAYTNRLVAGKPEVCFTQGINLKTATEAALHVKVTLDTLYKDPTKLRVLVNASNSSGPLGSAGINYNIGTAKLRLQGKAKTDATGSYALLLPKRYVTPTQHNLEVHVKSGTEQKNLYLNIPVKEQQTSVKFYPEGGHLIAGLPNKIAWEVKTAGGTALKVSGILLANNEAIGTVNTDAYGMGSFNLIPVANVKYTVKLSGVYYELPAALANGLVMHTENAVVNDSLKLLINGTYAGEAQIIVHNYRQIFYAYAFKTQPGGKYLTMDVSALPRGLNVLTVLDSLHRPVAERLFFAHYAQKPKIFISIDKTEPGTRQKVNVKIKLNGMEGKAANGVVSVACVEDSRFEIKNNNNIEDYTYLQSQLDNLPVKENLLGSAEADRRYMNELLLVRGWRKYRWPELMQSSPADTLQKHEDVVYKGTIEYLGGRIKKPVQLVVVKDSGRVNPLNSSANGNFSLENRDLYTAPGRRLRMIVTGESDEYIIKIKDPYLSIDETLAKNIEPIAYDGPPLQNTKEFVLTGFQHAIHLREVIIGPKKDDLHGLRGSGQADYVCRFHILNCPIHLNALDNHAPTPGEMVYAGPIKFGLTPYSAKLAVATRPGMILFDGIYTAKEYYGADYAYSNPEEPDYMSTICWKQGVILNSSEETTLSFYTSDITGKFRIVVQGVSNEDVIYGQNSFEVIKK